MAQGFNTNYRGVGDMLRSDFMVAEMRKRAEKVRAQAEATAPVDTGGPHPGRYKGSFAVESGIRSQDGDRRAYGRVTNDAPEAFFVEFGTKNNPRHRTLGKALDAAKD